MEHTLEKLLIEKATLALTVNNLKEVNMDDCSFVGKGEHRYLVRYKDTPLLMIEIIKPSIGWVSVKVYDSRELFEDNSYFVEPFTNDIRL